MTDSWLVVFVVGGVLLFALMLMMFRRGARAKDEGSASRIDSTPENSPSYRAQRDLDDRGDADGGGSGGGDGGGD